LRKERRDENKKPPASPGHSHVYGPYRGLFPYLLYCTGYRVLFINKYIDRNVLVIDNTVVITGANWLK
jgi:hypothetical protein